MTTMIIVTKITPMNINKKHNSNKNNNDDIKISNDDTN